jgi:hypothetical protein
MKKLSIKIKIPQENNKSDFDFEVLIQLFLRIRKYYEI